MSDAVTAEHRTKAAPAYFKAVTDGSAPEGTFDAVVAVFNNVDLGGDRIIPGAFAASIEAWRKSGDPVPVIFSHQWDDLNAHVGSVDPNNLKELLPGDPELPAELKALGGLLAKGAQIDLDAPGEAGDFAKNLWSKLKSRAIKEFSFAYDIQAARPTKDAMDLIELDLIEIGPTLKGMNPSTALLGAKAVQQAIEGKSATEALDLLDGLLPPPPKRSTVRRPAAVDDTKSAEVGTKRLPTGSRPDGAIEDTLDTIAASARVWATLKYGQELYACHVEGTFLEQGKALITAERWSDPWGEGPLWELAYSMDAAGCTITDANPVEVTVTLNALSPADAKQRVKRFIDAGHDRKTAIWLCILDDNGVDGVYESGEGSTSDAGGGPYAASRKRGQGVTSDPAEGNGDVEEPSAALSPIGVLLEFDDIELAT